MTGSHSKRHANDGKDGSEAAAPAADCERHREALLDEAIEESFPASDPPSIAEPAGKGC
jgi:hypothetical protein